MKETKWNRLGARAGRFAASLSLAAVLGFAGCGKKETESVPGGTTNANPTAVAAPADPFDMSELQSAFAGSDGGTRLFVQEIVDTIRGRDFAFGLEQLQKLKQKPGLSAEQSQAVQTALQKVQRWASSQGRR